MNWVTDVLNFKIIWKKKEDGSLKGKDKFGNKWYQPANQETCTCTLAGGYSASCWSVEDATFYALRERTKFDINETIVHLQSIVNNYDGISSADLNDKLSDAKIQLNTITENI